MCFKFATTHDVKFRAINLPRKRFLEIGVFLLVGFDMLQDTISLCCVHCVEDKGHFAWLVSFIYW